MRQHIKLISAILMVLSLSACGLKGPLYLPSEKVAAVSTSHSHTLNKTA